MFYLSPNDPVKTVLIKCDYLYRIQKQAVSRGDFTKFSFRLKDSLETIVVQFDTPYRTNENFHVRYYLFLLVYLTKYVFINLLFSYSPNDSVKAVLIECAYLYRILKQAVSRGNCTEFSFRLKDSLETIVVRFETELRASVRHGALFPCLSLPARATTVRPRVLGNYQPFKTLYIINNAHFSHYNNSITASCSKFKTSVSCIQHSMHRPLLRSRSGFSFLFLFFLSLFSFVSFFFLSFSFFFFFLYKILSILSFLSFIYLFLSLFSFFLSFFLSFLSFFCFFVSFVSFFLPFLSFFLSFFAFFYFFLSFFLSFFISFFSFFLSFLSFFSFFSFFLSFFFPWTLLFFLFFFFGLDFNRTVRNKKKPEARYRQKCFN